jgi:hypothetical protein
LRLVAYLLNLPEVEVDLLAADPKAQLALAEQYGINPE